MVANAHSQVETAVGLIRLGLIGDNIAASQSPRLHQLAGELVGRKVTYERVVPRALGLDFDATFAHCASAGFVGVNITYPYKERAALKVKIDDPLVSSMGAVNTVLFKPEGIFGFNTDYTGFITAYQRVRGTAHPGRVLMIGAGGVGKAVAFGLIKLGVEEITIVDHDHAKAQALCETLKNVQPSLNASAGTDASHMASGVEGIINCTPVGMVGIGGSPLPKEAMAGAQWAFDAVYTPVDTLFLQDATAAGLSIISGYALFFHQGVDAWFLFTGLPIDQDALKAALQLQE